MKALLKIIIPSPLIALAKTVLAQLGRLCENIPKDSHIFSDPQQQIFFGYYDINPLSKDDRFLLAGRTPAANISPHADHPVLELGYYDLEQNQPNFQPFAQTKTWNWQQGCRLQWFGSYKDAVIFNALHQGNYIAVIQNIVSGEIIKSLPSPIYAVSTDGSFSLTLDFERLHNCRPGYGYNHLPDKSRQDVIQYIDITTGAVQDIMSMDQVLEFLPLPSMDRANHYFNHLSISPSGTRYMVTHLWVAPSGKRYSRLIIADPQDELAYICPNNSGHTSHYCWQGDDAVMIFGTHEGFAAHYHLYNLHDKTHTTIGEGALTQDGHPTWIDDMRLITDTYPDYLRRQHLLYFDTQMARAQKLGSFYSPLNFTGEMRCDLHPRLNHHKNKICVDIIRNGRRAMCVVDIPRSEGKKT